MDDEDKENPESIEFLLDISKEVKHFYETPVIFLTKKDYSDLLFNTMCHIRRLIRGTGNIDQSAMIEQIVDYHLNWLHSVNEIINFKKGIHELPKEELYQAISYTIDAMGYRLKYYQRYMEKYRPCLPNNEQIKVQTELEIVEEMHRDVINTLLEKLKCFRNFSGDEEFHLKVYDAEEELLQWIDKIHDGLSMLLSKYVNLNMPHLTGELTKTLQQIVDDLQKSSAKSAVKLLEDLKQRGREMSTMVRCTATRNLEVSKVVEKINVLEDRIRRMEKEPSSAALTALMHKKEYLEKRLSSIENLKTNIRALDQVSDVQFPSDIPEDEICECKDFFRLRIFNHALPLQERERLVSELCYLWDLAVFGDRSHKSIISILSAAEMREEFVDELGTFYIDEHSRKIYKLPDDATLYQLNELNELIPIADDADHVYFYDECGRYYNDAKSRQRVYKAHATASEYMMDSSGVLLKLKEERDGVTYYYDNYGRYYINEEGKHIYRDPDTISEYEHDGLGNLVRIRSHTNIIDPCPDDVHVTEDFKYLKSAVGQALRECIADAVLHQPADPIKYLSTSLIKYRENMELKDRRNREKEDLETEREYIRAEERVAAERAAMEAALLAQGGSEASYDSNLFNYASLHDDDGAPTPSSKVD